MGIDPRTNSPNDRMKRESSLSSVLDVRIGTYGLDRHHFFQPASLNNVSVADATFACLSFHCDNSHLIADHLSWFTETPDEPKTVEQMVAEKGGRVRTGRKTSGLGGVDGDQGETIEILSDSEADALEKSVQEQEAQQQQQQ